MMDERKGFWNDCFRVGTPACGYTMGALGVVLAFLLLFLGFWRTVMVAVFFGVGYMIGANTNKTKAIKDWINKLFPPKGE